MPIQHFKLVTPVQPVQRLDLPPAQKSLVDPHNATGTADNPIYLLDGEFVTFDADYKFSREGAGTPVSGGLITADPADADSVAKVPCFPFWMERGRTDISSLPDGMLTVLLGGSVYEADIHSNILASGETFEVGDRLYINWLSNGATRNRRRGLTKVHNAADAATARVHAFVTRVYGAGDTYKFRALFGTVS